VNRREQRRRRSKRRVGGAVTISVVMVAVAGWAAWHGVAGGSDSAPAAVHAPRHARDRVTTTTVAPATTTTATPTTAGAPPPSPTTAAAPPAYGIGVTKVTLVDPSRPGPARGSTPATPQRRLPVTVRYPVAGAAGAGEATDAAAAPGAFPLVVFAHGFDVSADTYATLEHGLAAAGFVVAAPDFPLSSSAFPGPAVETDIVNQALDVSFVITSFGSGLGLPAVLAGHVAPTKAGVVGQSDGGITVAEAAANSCCADTRIGAVAVLSGEEGNDGGTWFATAGPPLLVMQGTDDDINPPALSQRLYDAATSPKLYVSILGAGHLEPYTTGPQEGAVATVVVDFLLEALDGASGGTVTAAANVPGVLALTQSAP
jgi:dienelactone hydrolase